MKKPKSIWIILDPLDGTHVFTTEYSAWKTYNQWKKEAIEDTFNTNRDAFWDSFWEMSKPIEYVKK